MYKPLHVTFGPSAALSLQDSFRYDARIAGEVISLNEDLSLGPLKNLDSQAGAALREKWLSLIAENSSELPYLIEADHLKYEQIKSSAAERDVYIWAGSDSRSRLGLSRMLYEINFPPEKTFILDYPQLLRGKDGIWAFVNIGILPPEQISELNQYFRLLDFSDKSVEALKWIEISNQEATLRVVEEGIVTDVPDNYFDKIILSHCSRTFKTSARVVGETLWDVFSNEQTISDSFLNWRLKELVKLKVLCMKAPCLICATIP